MEKTTNRLNTDTENNPPVACPYCGKEMQGGNITGDGRGSLFWQAAGTKRRISDYLGGRGLLKSVSYKNFWRFTLKGNYCPGCKKLIIDTEIQK